jgi:hypothetical protein
MWRSSHSVWLYLVNYWALWKMLERSWSSAPNRWESASKTDYKSLADFRAVCIDRPSSFQLSLAFAGRAPNSLKAHFVMLKSSCGLRLKPSQSPTPTRSWVIYLRPDLQKTVIEFFPYIWSPKIRPITYLRPIYVIILLMKLRTFHSSA